MTPKTLDKYIAKLKKQATAEGWSKAEYLQELNKLHDEMIDQYNTGKITYSEMMGVQKKILNAEKNQSLQGKTATKASSAPMTKEEMKSLSDLLKQKYMSGILTFDEWDEKKTKITEAYKAGKSLAEAETDTGLTLPKAASKASAASSGPVGMTSAEYADMSAKLDKKLMAGLISTDEHNALKQKLNSHYANHTPIQDVEKDVGLDPGTLATDQAIIDLGNEIKQVYHQATTEMSGKLTAFLMEHEDEINELNQKLQDGTITQDEYKHLQAMLIQKTALAGKYDQLTGVMLNANKKALGMVNGQQVGVFAENANYQSYQLEQDAKLNLSFAVYDEDTAAKLLKDKPELLPRKVDVNGKKDAAWNQKIIAGAVLQSVIQGESIPAMAKRIATQTGETNMKAMVRYARTAMTSAQNSGRMESLHRAKGMGIKCKKRWLATLDSRTRDSHQAMDGVTVDVDADFVTPLGSKMQFPGDLAGKPGDVWNCRCTLVYEYEDYPNDPTDNERLYYDEYWTTETDANGKEKKVFHRESKLVTDMNYDEWSAAKKGSKLNDLNVAKVHLAEVQKECLKKRVSETKVYKDLWKDPVKLEDYPAKKAGIQAKRDYYTAEIDKLNHAIANGESWAKQDKVDELVKKRKLLDEFEKHGALLEERNKALKDVQNIYDQVGLAKTAQANVAKSAPIKKAKSTAAASGGANTGTAAQSGAGMSLSTAGGMKTQFAPDAWDSKTKNAARNFRSRYDADKVLRPELDAIWDTLTDEEKYGVWLYTWNSNPMNKPLSGHHDSWDRLRGFVGYENAVWGHEDDYSNRDISGYGEMGRFARRDGHAEYKKGIELTTKAIEKSEMKEGQWLVRGSTDGGLAGWFAGAGMNFDTVTQLFDGSHTEQDMKKALVGKKAINHAFTSTAIARDAGFSGNVKYRIYAPKGTHGIYAEPQSHYGDTTGGHMGTPVPKSRQDKLYKKGEKFKDVGGEAEIILQRGTTYVCTGIRITGYDYRGRPEVEVEMEVVEQPDFFVHGDENTYDGGKTRHKR